MSYGPPRSTTGPRYRRTLDCCYLVAYTFHFVSNNGLIYVGDGRTVGAFGWSLNAIAATGYRVAVSDEIAQDFGI